MKCPTCTTVVAEESPSCPSCGTSLGRENWDADTQILPEGSKPAASGDSPRARTSGGAGVSSSTPSNRTHSHTISDSLDGGKFVAGTIIGGRYRIVGLLGRGGMGEVYRADDLTLEQPVALKFLPAALALDGAATARFHREVRIARQISHRNVCRVYDIGEHGGLQFLSMEFIRGEELSSVLKRFGRLPADKATEIARQLCAGLAAAHDAGVLHRDLKPGNVMIDENGNVRITDFGLAGLAEEFGAGAALEGTPEYMSPEQLAGRELTVRSDIYSLGLVLYEIYAGKKAFKANTLADLLRLRKSDSMPESLSSVARDTDPIVERVIERCIAADPKDRPGSALQVAAALPGGDPLAAALAAGETPSPEMVAAAPKEGSLRPSVAAAMLAATLALIALCLFLADRVTLYSRVPLEKSAQGLRERAAELAKKFGYESATDSHSGFFIHEEYLKHIRDNDKSPARWEQLRTGRPVALGFWYRQSPQYLVPLSRQAVTQGDPPRNVSGMAGLSLDTSGRLIGFYGVPPQTTDDVEAGAFDWSKLFAEAGLEQSDFRETEPQWTPAHAFDDQRAWEGVQPGRPDAPLRVEAAAFRGRLVTFQLVNPWNRPAREEQPRQGAGQRMIQAVVVLGFFVVLVGAGLLARHNLRLGRGDRRGAFRIAAVVFVLETAAWLTASHHVWSLGGEFAMFLDNLAVILLISGMMWLVYIAIEPFVRKRWPGIIISWNRLLAGDYRDPLVGRDVLIGALCGFVFVLTGFAQTLAPAWLGFPPPTPAPSGMGGLGGTQYALAVTVAAVVNALIFPAVTLFMLLLFTMVLRNRWAAAGAVFLILTLLGMGGGETPAVDLFFALAGAALILLVLLRFGLLAAVFAQFFSLLFYFFPVTTEFSAWYAGTGIYCVALCVALALYGFKTSLAGEPLFRASLDD